MKKSTYNTDNQNDKLLKRLTERLEKYNKLIEKIIIYKEKHGDYNGITQDKEIGVAVMNLRANYKNSIYNIPECVIAKLEEIEFPFVVRSDWFTPFYENLIQYKQEHDSFANITRDPKIGNIVNQLRQAKKGKVKTYKLTQEMIDKLNAIGFPWEVNKQEWFDKFFIKLIEYKQVHGSFDHVRADKNIGKIVARVRAAKKGQNNYVLAQNMIDKLNSIGFDWGSDQAEITGKWFKPFCEKLIAYKTLHGSFRGIVCDKEIGCTVANVRLAKKGNSRTKLTSQMIQKLDEIGFPWEAEHRDWFSPFYEKLIIFKEHHGNFFGVTNDKEIGHIVGNIRAAYKGKGNINLTPDMIEKLDAIQFTWKAEPKYSSPTKTNSSTI